VLNGLVPAGTPLHVRLTSAVGSYASKPGSPVSAVVIAPVVLRGETLLPAGSRISGYVKSVSRVGLGIRHEVAGLDLDFDRLTPPDSPSLPLAARVVDVDNSRERVTPNGRIHGIRATSSLCYRVSGYLRMLLPWEVHAEIAEWAIKSLIADLPEPEIYYPQGVELTLALKAPLLVNAFGSWPESTERLDGSERAELNSVMSQLPDQTLDPYSGRPSDLTNFLLLGSRDEIVAAFAAAGWTPPAISFSLRQKIKFIRATAELHGDSTFPMLPLSLEGTEADMSWEKGLNDVSKRHHVRIWRAGEWRGREVWVGAATRDINFAYLRPGQALTHKIDENIDQERDKVAYDLAFTTCSGLLDWIARPGRPRTARNGTGDLMLTDGRVAVIGLNSCASPRLATETGDTETLPPRGGRLQRFVRREILCARNDAMRTNLYWRTFEGARFAVSYLHQRRQRTLARDAAQRQPPAEAPVPPPETSPPPSNPGTIEIAVAR